MPDRWDRPDLGYSPFPLHEPRVRNEQKFLIVQISGSAANPTPEATYHLNWKSKGRCSTVHLYYFNFDNRQGLGLHAYGLPGPPRESRLHLLEIDARWLFDWGRGLAAERRRDGGDQAKEQAVDYRPVPAGAPPLWLSGQTHLNAFPEMPQSWPNAAPGQRLLGATGLFQRMAARL
jgi:hypothetical protein